MKKWQFSFIMCIMFLILSDTAKTEFREIISLGLSTSWLIVAILFTKKDE